MTGDGVTIAVIDTGIDYTHADFGGSGNPADYAANDPTVIESGTFPTAKVIAGYDFAGNNYDADGKAGSTTPAPDPDPLDCADHGSHVVGDRGRAGRPGRPLHLHRSLQRLDHRRERQVRRRSRRGPAGQARRAQGLRLRGQHEPGRRRARVGRGVQRRPRRWHRRREHVPRRAVRLQHGPGRGRDQQPRRHGRRRRRLRGQRELRPVHHRRPGGGHQGHLRGGARRLPGDPDGDRGPARHRQRCQRQQPERLPGPARQRHRSTSSRAPAMGSASGCTPADYDAGTAGKIVVIRRGVCAFVDKGAARPRRPARSA